MPVSTYSTRVKLGRWNIDNNKKTELKIYYANEDHCGVCTDGNSKVNILEKNDEMKKEEYYKAFII